MLRDYRIEQERWAAQRRARKTIALVYGHFIAGLARWDWFVNPLTLRDRDRACESREPRGELHREGLFAICKPDPRIALHEIGDLCTKSGTTLPPSAALSKICHWLLRLQEQAGKPIGWMIAEEFGRVGGRWHCHALVTGVSSLDRHAAWLQARREFGYTNINRFDPSRGAAFYAAKYAGRQPGQIHFGGTLADKDLSKCEERLCEGRKPAGGQDVATSAAVPRSLFHMSLPRWHR